MNDQMIGLLAKSLKGAPMSCLFVMMIARRPMGVMELAKFTGYHKQTVRQGLDVLADLVLAANHERYGGWQLTDQGYQLTLAEGENLDLPPSSSSGFLDSGLNTDSGEEEQLQPGRSKKSPSRVELAPEAEEVVEVLVQRCSCPPRVARSAVARALEAGDRTLLRIHYDIIKWLAYCLSDRGKGINSVAYFVAKQIGEGVPPPQWFDAAFKFEVELRDLEIEMGKEGGAGWLS